MKKLLGISLLMCIWSIWAWSQQTTGTVNGTIYDSQGAAVAGAQISIKEPATGFTRSTVSGSAGEYTLPLLPPGTYTLNVQMKGFSSVQQKGIELRVGQVLSINQTLKPGGTTEVVEVTTEAPLIETSNSSVVGSVSPTEVSSLPILDRNFSGLETLIPGVRQAEGFDPTKTRVGNISVNGGDGRQVDTNVDGGDNKDLVVGGLVQNFTMEGIQEFNVATDRYSAEAGHSVAAIVNVISKSGTNSFHGSAFGLFQNSALNKIDYFTEQTCKENNVTDCRKPLYHRYHFGGSFGGPFIKDKFFFFGAFEQKREPQSISVNPPSFTDITSLASQTQGFPGGPYGFPVQTLASPYIDSLATVKLDYKVSDRQNLFMRYGRQKWTAPNDQLGNPFNTDLSQSNGDINNFHDLSIGHNFTISSNKVNSLNLHFQDMVNAIPATPVHTFSYPLVGGGTIDSNNLNLLFSDGTNVGVNANVPQQTLIRKYQIRDDFNWTHGAHSFKFGTNYIYFAKMGGFFYSQRGYTLTFWNDPVCIASNTCTVNVNNQNVAFLYPQGLSTPGAVQDVLLDGGIASTAQPPWHSLGLYIQDDYKVSPHLTLNLGVRWDANIDFLRAQLGSSLTNSNKVMWDLTQVMNNSAFPASDPGGQRIRQIVGNVGDLRRSTADWKEFQPRLGFAWDMFGDSKHVLRGGYGIARDQIFQNITLWSILQSQPAIYQGVFEVTASNPPTAPGQCSVPASSPVNVCTFRFGVDPLPTPPAASTDLAFGSVGRITNPKITDPWSQQWSLGYAWQIHPDYALSVDYHHILGTHEERVLNANPEIRALCDSAFPGSNPADPRCVNGADTRLMDFAFQATNTCVTDLSGTNCGAGRFAHIYDYSTNNRSRYDGINFQLKKRMSHRLMFQTSYVLSWSDSWGGFPVASYGGSPLAVTPEQQFQPNEFARTTFDERNRFVFSGTVQLPGGVEVSPIFQAASGRPYSFLAGKDVDGDVRRILDRVCTGSTLTDPIVTDGCTMIKPNTLTGKPYVEMDLRMGKTFNLGERARLAINWEFFNLFNRANFCNSYEQDVSASTFNTPQSYCNGPSNAVNGGVSGANAAAIPALRSQFGFRFEF